MKKKTNKFNGKNKMRVSTLLAISEVIKSSSELVCTSKNVKNIEKYKKKNTIRALDFSWKHVGSFLFKFNIFNYGKWKNIRIFTNEIGQFLLKHHSLL